MYIEPYVCILSLWLLSCNMFLNSCVVLDEFDIMIYFPTDGHLNSFQLSAVMSKTALHFLMSSFFTHIFHSSSIPLKSEVSES